MIGTMYVPVLSKLHLLMAHSFLAISYYTWVKSLEAAPPPSKDVDLETIGNRKRGEDSNDGDGEVTVIFGGPEDDEKV
jgi:hypothetical protein